MANFVSNDIIIRGTKADIDKMFDEVIVQVKNEYTKRMDDYFDFNKVIPMPPHQPDTNKPNPFWGEGHDLGQAERKKYGKNNWYDWAVANWETKWNASSDQMISRAHIEGATASIYFSTAWSPPESIFYELSRKYPTLTFDIKWIEEQGFGAQYTLKKGKMSNYEDISEDWDEDWDEDEDEDEEEEQ